MSSQKYYTTICGILCLTFILTGVLYVRVIKVASEKYTTNGNEKTGLEFQTLKKGTLNLDYFP